MKKFRKHIETIVSFFNNDVGLGKVNVGVVVVFCSTNHKKIPDCDRWRCTL